MLGISLLFVGFALIHNGICILKKVEAKTMAIFNFIAGGLLFVLNVIAVTQAGGRIGFEYAAEGFMFAITYILLGFFLYFGKDFYVIGLYGGYAAIFAAIVAVVTFIRADSFFGYYLGALWVLWFFLWGEMFVENVMKVNMKKFPAYFLIFEGVFSAFIPSVYLLLCNASILG